jgi:SAM-dependent methyltransferase
MYMTAGQEEFVGARSSAYGNALALFPDAWTQDMADMLARLKPREGERVLDVGGGTGYFSHEIARRVGPAGAVVVVDPSAEQLQQGPTGRANIQFVAQGADELDLDEGGFDAVWCRGAFHHVPDKTQAFRRLAAHCRPGARLVLIDVFAGSPTARYFDDFVARTCITGHEVAFLSNEFAHSLCALTGWEDAIVEDQTYCWSFERIEDVGIFLKDLFAAGPEFDAHACLEGARAHLEISRLDGRTQLHWPMSILSARRS